MKTGSFQVDGLAALEKQLLGLPDKLAKNVMFGAMRAGAVVIQKAAREKCPVSAEEHWVGKKGSKGRFLAKPGDLKKRGIRVKRLKKGQGPTPITVAAYVSNRYWYGKFVEFGHVITRKPRTRSEKKVGTGRWKGGFVRPYPFMRPAWDANKQKALAAARDYLKERIPKELANVK